MLRNVLKIEHLCKKYTRFFCTIDTSENISSVDNLCDSVKKVKRTRSQSERIDSYLKKLPYYREIKNKLPEKYLQLKKRECIAYLYLLDKRIAESVVSHITNTLRTVENKFICDTNAGFGFISEKLLKKGAKVRIYETCPEFRKHLRTLCEKNIHKTELYTKDIYHLSTMSYIDKIDQGTRVQKLLNGLPKVPWTADPAVTIVGPMPQNFFLIYLIRMVVHQAEIIQFGRVEMFAILGSNDYMKLTAQPNTRGNKYQSNSILFQLFFDYKLLEGFDRKHFVPWETKQKAKNPEEINLVHIVLKKKLPVEKDLMLALYYFVKQGFGRGKKQVIPTLEKWLPGSGAYLLASPSIKNANIDLNIYTEFGKLTPNQILVLFIEMVKQPGYRNSPFIALMEAELLKLETVESDMLQEQSQDEEPMKVDFNV